MCHFNLLVDSTVCECGEDWYVSVGSRKLYVCGIVWEVVCMGYMLWYMYVCWGCDVCVGSGMCVGDVVCVWEVECVC